MLKLDPLETLRHRRQFPEFLKGIKAKIIAEIGVLRGENLLNMLKYDGYDEAVAIDSYCNNHPSNKGIEFPKAELDGLWENLLSIKQSYPKLTVIRKLSAEAVLDFSDGHFDFVYIDSDHAYESIREDIDLWWPKVKKGGYLTGHDYNKVTLSNGVPFGVIRAVNEFAVKIKQHPKILECTSWVFEKHGENYD